MRHKTYLLTCTLTGSALLLGCNINLAGANISGNLDADIKVDNQGGIGNTTHNNGQGNNSGPGPGPTGLQDVKSLQIVANLDTLVYGVRMPWETDARPYEGPTGSGGGGPTLFPTPKPVGEPYPVPGVAAKIQLMATVGGNSQPVQVGPEDPNFSFSFEPNVQMTFDRREGWLYPTKDTPAGDVTLKVSYKGGVLTAKKAFKVVSGGQAAVEAE